MRWSVSPGDATAWRGGGEAGVQLEFPNAPCYGFPHEITRYINEFDIFKIVYQSGFGLVLKFERWRKSFCDLEILRNKSGIFWPQCNGC